jgi:Fe-S oxidoreductase
MMSDFITPFGTSGYILFWGLFVAAFGFFINRIILLIRLLRLGRPEPWNPGWTTGITGKVLLQLCNLRRVKWSDLAGFGHALLFWGFGLFFISYILFLGTGAGFGLWGRVEGTSAWTVTASILDIAGICVILAVIWAAVRRFIVRPARLKRDANAGIILGLVFCLMVLHFLSGGFSYAKGYWAGAWPPVEAMLGNIFVGLPETSIDIGYLVTWWLHFTLILGFLIYIPYSKHLHILASPLNVVFRNRQRKGVLSTPDIDKEDVVGAGHISSLTRNQILDLYSCAECGRCHEVCPAVISGKSLSPREQVLSLKNHLIKTGPALLKNGNDGISFIGNAITEDEIWDCVTCMACEEVCPVDVRHVERMVAFRRNQVLMKAEFPAKIRQFYRNIEENSNPWGKAWTYRANWSEGLHIPGPLEDSPIDTIYWAGCLGAYDDRIQRISTSIIRLLNESGIRFSILGKKEMCCGDAIRRTGNEYLFRKLALQNIDTFRKNGVRRIITPCPHCYHVFKNEYPHLGGNYEVLHHTQLIADLLHRGNIRTPETQLNKTVVYHDPCYLGRYNGIYRDPRQILQSIPGIQVIEKRPYGEDALCCGAGGGGMWMSETGRRRTSRVLLDQVTECHPAILATACPYCLTMLENEAREGGMETSLAVMDIAEILQNSLS